MKWIPAALRGAAIWATVGTLVAMQVISWPHLIAAAIFFIPRIALPAVVLGALHGLWIEAERDRRPWMRHPVLMGGATGAAIGILGVLPACAYGGMPVLERSAVAVYALAALVAGYCAGGVLASLPRGGLHAAVAAPWSPRRLALPLTLWLGAAGVEGVTLGPTFLSYLLPPALSLAAVKEIPPGSARGTARSGYYSLKAMNVDGSGGWDCLATVTERDGALTIACEGNHAYEGALDADDRFRVGTGYVSTAPDAYAAEYYALLTGRFTSDTTLDIEQQTQARLRTRPTPTRMLWRGHGRKCAGSDAGSCSDRVSRAGVGASVR